MGERLGPSLPIDNDRELISIPLEPLTPTQFSTYKFIISHQEEHGSVPSIRAINEKFSLASTSVGHNRIKALVEKRYIFKAEFDSQKPKVTKDYVPMIPLEEVWVKVFKSRRKKAVTEPQVSAK